MTKKLGANTKYTIDEVKKIFDESGCVLLESTYVNNRTKMRYICSCGNESSIILTSFIKGTRCYECGLKKQVQKRSYDYEQVFNMFRQNGCELLDKEYKNSHTKLNYICSCGKKTTITFQKFLMGRKCRECSKNKKYNFEKVKKEFEINGCQLISDQYKNCKEKLKYKCVCGNVHSITFDAFKHGKRCNDKECIKKRTKDKHSNYRWDKNKIKNELLKLYNNKEDISSKNLNDKHASLYYACTHHFGSVKCAMENAGINYFNALNNPKGIWYEEKVLRTIKKHYESGDPVTSAFCQKTMKGLYHAAIRLFGSWKKTLIACELDVDKIYKKAPNGTYTKNYIMDKIAKMKAEGLHLNSSYVAMKFPGMFNAANKIFGSWRSAIESVGIEYESIKLDDGILQTAGYEFEKLLDNLLMDIGIEYKKYDHEFLDPDYVFDNGKWADAKLSEWSNYRSETIPKYELHCRFLTLIFMRGDKSTDRMITKKTRLISVYKLIKQLPIHKQRYYTEQIEKIEYEINDIKDNDETIQQLSLII